MFINDNKGEEDNKNIRERERERETIVDFMIVAFLAATA